MTALDWDLQRRIVAIGRLAPSAHNTQPARWRFDADGSIVLLGDTSRRLPCADPHDRDFALSCGAALEATALALGAQGVGLVAIESCETGQDALRPMARLVTGGMASHDPLAHWVQARHTWRGGFARASHERTQSLHAWAMSRDDDVRIASESSDRAWLAGLNDRATVGFLRDAQWRAELRAWMRFSTRHPHYRRDGMNRQALALGAVEAAGARWVLGDAFGWLDRMGVADALVGERARSMTAAAIIVVHRPADEPALASGRVLYRRWLELTSLGFAAWPMSAAVDDPAGAAEITARMAIPAGRRLLAALRVGPASAVAPSHVRLPVDELIAA